MSVSVVAMTSLASSGSQYSEFTIRTSTYTSSSE